MKTCELSGAALDWEVAKCDGLEFDEAGQPIWFPESDEYFAMPREKYAPSTDWCQGGPIIERAIVSLGVEDGGWRALCWGDGPNRELYSMRGPSPLIAAMRCYVASKLGDEVEIPEGLE